MDLGLNYEIRRIYLEGRWSPCWGNSASRLIDAGRTHSLVTTFRQRNFDYLQLQPPKQSSPETENQIKILREEMGSILQDTGTWTWNKNHTKGEIGSLRRTLKDPTTSLILSDKTGRTCALPKSLVQDRTARQLTEGWMELPADPSQATEKAANKILKKCFADSDMCDDYVLGRQRRSMRVNSSKVFIEDTIIPIRAQTHPELYQVSILYHRYMGREGCLVSRYSVIRQYLNDHHEELDLLGFNPNSIIEMLQFIFTNAYARVDSDKYYHQTSGVGTGYHSSAAYAEVIVDHTYKTALAALTPADHPISLVTYMDDSHTTWDTRDGHLPLLLLELFQTGSNLKCQLCSINGRISFLDVTIHVNRGKPEYELFQKDTHSGQYLHWDSHCPRGTKLNIVKSETKRIWDLCSQEEKAWKHLEKLRSNFVSSGYPHDQVSMMIADQVAKLKTPGVSRPPTNEPEFVLKFPYTNEAALRKAKKAVRKSGIAIRLAPSAGNSLGSLIKRAQCRQTTTTQCNCALHQTGLDVDCKATNVVYDIGCKTCGKHYVGATNRRLLERLNEHEASSRLHTLATTIGFHSREHGEGEGHTKGRPYIRDYDEFVRKYNVKILSRNRDTLVSTCFYEGVSLGKFSIMLEHNAINLVCNLCRNVVTKLCVLPASISREAELPQQGLHLPSFTTVVHFFSHIGPSSPLSLIVRYLLIGVTGAIAPAVEPGRVILPGMVPRSAARHLV
eukprot:sb/3462462/